MGAKGETSRRRILDASRELFAAKGYSRVTMKDICDAVGMSRGGVYRHYPSTEAIFSALIDDEQQRALAALQKAEDYGISPLRVLTVFFKNRIRVFLNPENNIENAITEFAANSESGKELLIKRAEVTVSIASRQISRGREMGLFTCRDSDAAARHIIWLLEGMAKHNALIPLSEEDIALLLEEFMVILGYSGK